MNQPNEDQKQPDNMELLKQQASACGSGCGCHTPNSSTKTRWVIGAIVLVAAGALAARALIKDRTAPLQASAPAFAAAVAPAPAVQTVKSVATAPTPIVQKAVSVAQTTVPEGSPAPSSEVVAPPADTSAGTSIGAFAELNTVAAMNDAVFVYLPGKHETSANPPWTPMQAAARTIQSKAGLQCGLFILKAGSPDYTQVAAQVPLPGILALVKGRGMRAITGDITEEKLIQGFVAASSAGGCGASGGGCGPAAAGCN